MTTITAPVTANTLLAMDPEEILQIIAKRSFANLATVSAGGSPHTVGVLYAAVGRDIYVSTELGTRKAKNIAHEQRVAIAIPVRRLPIGPPMLIHFQTTAEMIPTDDRRIRSLLDAGDLEKVTSHGELELADGCFLKIPVPSRIHTYGLGLSLYRLIRDPLSAVGITHLPEG
jgi:hypothetical protein